MCVSLCVCVCLCVLDLSVSVKSSIKLSQNILFDPPYTPPVEMFGANGQSQKP